MADESTEFTLNGTPVRVAAAADTPLLWALRNDLGRRATRFGCGAGVCGACTVIVEGRAVTSCDMPLGAVAGRDVRSADGWSDDPRLRPIVAALVAHQAPQCGYCLPGIVMRAAAFLEGCETPPGRAEIAAALDDNLCRCGAHARILTAIEAAGRAMAADA